MSESKRKPKGKKIVKRVPAPDADLKAKVTQAAKDVTRKATQLAGDGIASIQSSAGDAVRSVRDEVESVRDEARKSFSGGRQAAIDWERGIEAKIKSRPLVSMLVAGVIGFLVGRWLKGNHRCEI